MQKRAPSEILERYLIRNKELAPLTTLRIGGTSERFYQPPSERDAALLICALRDEGSSFYVLGGGSNMLISDGSIDTPVISTSAMTDVSFELRGDEVFVECGSGAELKSIVRMSLDNGWTGAECLSGIPGSVGGAIVGNAGTQEGSMSRSLHSVRYIDESGSLRELAADEVSWGYRHSSFLGMRNTLITSAVIRLATEDSRDVRDRIRRAMHGRSSQPSGVNTAGCVFKNPPGDHAGRLLDAAGCKGLAVGGASVSEKHANFFVNAGGATARDMRSLIDMCIARVEARFGVRLELELRQVAI